MTSCNGVQGALLPLPSIVKNQCERVFALDEGCPDITSLDMAPHGAFILAGCGNGIILMFDLASGYTRGTVVGYIQAKGLHTNLLVTVKFSDDGRFGFAGVTKGSMELLALDFGRVPVWPEKGQERRHTLDSLVVPFTHSDPKLRGFGAVARIPTDQVCSKNIGLGPTYRLACGRGIKNVHIWQFFPDAPGGAQWTCIFDVASNGNTIETIHFRAQGSEVVSKSAGVVLRIWELGKDKNAAEDSKDKDELKITFTDVPNSQDARTSAGNFAFGGDYSFAVVKLDAPKEANRDALSIPSKPSGDDDGGGSNRRRRQMRQIGNVSATNDGMHVLVQCSDGGALYFNNASEDEQHGGIVEMAHLEYDPETDGAWVIQRAGKDGDVNLVRAVNRGGVGSIMVSLLAKEVATTAWSVQGASLTKALVEGWNDWGYFFDKLASEMQVKALDDKGDGLIFELEGMMEAAVVAKSPRTADREVFMKEVREKKEAHAKTPAAKSSNGRGRPSTTTKDSAVKTPRADYKTPANKGGKRGPAAADDISPHDVVASKPRSSTPSASSSHKRPHSNTTTTTNNNNNNNNNNTPIAHLEPVAPMFTSRLTFRELAWSDEPREKRTLRLTSAPRVKRVVENLTEINASTVTLPNRGGLAAARKLCADWVESHRERANKAILDLAESPEQPSAPTQARRRIFEQCRLHLVFAERVTRCLTNADLSQVCDSLDDTLARYAEDVEMVTKRQYIEAQAECIPPSMLYGNGFLDMVQSASALEEQVRSLVQ